ncbi:uncharacterized protein F5147DRAFT_647816 [Suillus discolor]|uniref:Ribonuclease H1 N-terminal domain-containing protein n=1 Tax=Suillus discolor TaxID=1912936 RepID=A0A9P7JZT1_9AGAM|nr:uncharacterized protein F5147DRAFT_647816 [Suillus discolor]KAG2118658.1 hypothetical protein F5147DRAFT_647816 [Suillus discolor]
MCIVARQANAQAAKVDINFTLQQYLAGSSKPSKLAILSSQVMFATVDQATTAFEQLALKAKGLYESTLTLSGLLEASLDLMFDWIKYCMVLNNTVVNLVEEHKYLVEATMDSLYGCIGKDPKNHSLSVPVCSRQASSHQKRKRSLTALPECPQPAKHYQSLYWSRRSATAPVLKYETFEMKQAVCSDYLGQGLTKFVSQGCYRGTDCAILQYKHIHLSKTDNTTDLQGKFETLYLVSTDEQGTMMSIIFLAAQSHISGESGNCPPPRRGTHSTTTLPPSHYHNTADMPMVMQTAHASPDISVTAVLLCQPDTESRLGEKWAHGTQVLHVNIIEESEASDTDSITDTEDSQTNGNFYVVRLGRRPGVYSMWIEAVQQIDDVPGAMSKYQTKREAIADYRGFKYGRGLHDPSVALMRKHE